jgi:hypothetical protein
MNKYNVVAASAVALTAALASGDALAHGTLTTTKATYNAASVAAAGGTITVPVGTTASAVYTVTTLSGGITTSLEVNSRFTVTLPTGFTFASQPSFTVTPATTSTALLNGGIGSQSATFTITQAPLAVGGTLSLNQLSVQGATALETPGAALSITEQSTNNAQILNNDVLPLSQPLFASTTGVSAAFAFNFPNYQVDLTPPSLGTMYFVDPPVSIDAPVAPLAQFSLAPDGSLAADGLVIVALGTADTATVSVNGFFNGVKEGFTTVGGNTLGPFATPIATFPATATSVTYTDVAVTAPGVDLNIEATGTTLLQANNTNFAFTFTPGTGVTDFLGGSVVCCTPGLSGTDAIPFTGGIVMNTTDFLTGSDAGYTSLVRVTNGSAVTNTLFAVAQPFTGGPQLAGSLGTIGAGVGTVFTEAAIGVATGLTLANSGQRATLEIVAIPGGSVSSSGLLVNPGGVVDNVN